MISTNAAVFLCTWVNMTSQNTWLNENIQSNYWYYCESHLKAKWLDDVCYNKNANNKNKRTFFQTESISERSLNTKIRTRALLLRCAIQTDVGAKPAWLFQQPVGINQSCRGRLVQQHWCHEADGPHCWTETVSAYRPGFQSAATWIRGEKENISHQLADDIFQWRSFKSPTLRTKLCNRTLPQKRLSARSTSFKCYS